MIRYLLSLSPYWESVLITLNEHKATKKKVASIFFYLQRQQNTESSSITVIIISMYIYHLYKKSISVLVT